MSPFEGVLLSPLHVSANLSMLYADVPVLERFATAREAGFDAVEMWWPFAEPDPGDRALDLLVRAAHDSGVDVVCLNLDAGDVAAGERGLLSVPSLQARFAANVDVGLGLAKALGCSLVNALYGNRGDNVALSHQDELGLGNLVDLAHRATVTGATILLETLNSYDSPRYRLVRIADTVALVEQARTFAGTDNVALLLDVYHLTRMGDDPAKAIRDHRDRLGHIQLADAPGRGRPGTGLIDFAAVLAAADAVGYAGCFGLEYVPAPGIPVICPAEWNSIEPTTLEEVIP